MPQTITKGTVETSVFMHCFRLLEEATALAQTAAETNQAKNKELEAATQFNLAMQTLCDLAAHEATTTAAAAASPTKRSRHLSSPQKSTSAIPPFYQDTLTTIVEPDPTHENASEATPAAVAPLPPAATLSTATRSSNFGAKLWEWLTTPFRWLSSIFKSLIISRKTSLAEIAAPAPSTTPNNNARQTTLLHEAARLSRVQFLDAVLKPLEGLREILVDLAKIEHFITVRTPIQAKDTDGRPLINKIIEILNKPLESATTRDTEHPLANITNNLVAKIKEHEQIGDNEAKKGVISSTPIGVLHDKLKTCGSIIANLKCECLAKYAAYGNLLKNQNNNHQTAAILARNQRIAAPLLIRLTEQTPPSYTPPAQTPARLTVTTVASSPRRANLRSRTSTNSTGSTDSAPPLRSPSAVEVEAQAARCGS